MKIITAEEAFNVLLNAGIKSNPYFFDKMYVAPNKSWVLNEFSVALKEHNEKVGPYRPGTNDCDNYVNRAVEHAKTCLILTPELNEKGADMAAGHFCYMDDLEVKHDIVVWVVENGGKLEHLFYEPQKCCKVSLTEQQISLMDFSTL